MTAKKRLLDFQTFALCAVAFTIPFPFLVNTYTILLLTLTWLLQVRGLYSLKNVFASRATWPWIAFFLLHALSYFYCLDKDSSSFDIVSKLSFILFPLIVVCGMDITRYRLQHILAALVGGVVTVGIFFMLRAAWVYNHTGQADAFFYHTLCGGWDTNAIYYSWYTMLALTILLFFRFDYPIPRLSLVRGICFAVLLLFLILLASKMMLVVFLLFVVPAYLFRNVSGKGVTKRLGLFVAVIAILATVLITTKNPVRQRWDDIINSNVNEAFLDDYHGVVPSFSNLSTRLFLWRMGLLEMKTDNLWMAGTGNGDAHLLLNHRMHTVGIRDMYNTSNRSALYNVNLHNMYLQSLYMLGIGGAVSFLLLMFAPFVSLGRMKEKNLFFVFQVICVIFMTQEAALQTQAGIVFFSFVSALMWNRYYSERRREAHTEANL